MTNPSVRAVYRFPVKGFPGEQLESAFVRAGSGVDGDRAVALSNGLEAPRQGEWADCMTFTALKSDTSLQQWNVRATTRGAATDVTLTAPDGAAISLASDDENSLEAATPFLAERLQARGPYTRALVAAEQGMFDSRHAGLSFINTATVEALGRSADVELDPLRFRGNVLLEGMAPYEELGLVGAVLRVGGVRVWIRSAIERCSATRVNPVTTDVDINVPYLLASHLGHLHCGVYGVVLSDGEIRSGDSIIVERPPQPGLPAEAPEGAYKTRTDPRMATLVSNEVREGVLHLRLRDGLGWTTPHYAVGQNLRVHPVIEGIPTWRTYTITRVARDGDTDNADDIELLVAQSGVVSHHLAELPVGSAVVISGPYGRVTVDELGPSPATVTAGIGITPALTLARAGVRARAFHVGRDTDCGELGRELQGLVPTRYWATSTQGRPTLDALVAWLSEAEPSSVFVCGPAGFGTLVREAAAAVGIDDVFEEVFVSPVLIQEVPDLPPATIRFDDVVVPWVSGEGFILDALEAAGVDVPSSCRAGSCGTCRLRVREGEVSYPVEPAAAGGDDVLACCAYPAGDVVLERIE